MHLVDRTVFTPLFGNMLTMSAILLALTQIINCGTQKLDDQGQTIAKTSLNNSSLAFGGQFIGSPYAGTVTANCEIRRYQNGIRFRATASGKINAVRYQNRHLTDFNIEDRCGGKSSGVWCNCFNNNISGTACGWTLSNSYHAGNGGLQTVTIHPDDGTDKHLPDLSDTLATSDSYYPSDKTSNRFIAIDLDRNVSVAQGEFYHIVWTNSDMPPPLGPDNDIIIQGISNEDAKKWGSSYGAIGLNGWGAESTELATNPIFRHNAVYGRHDPADEFSEDTDTRPFYDVRYSDGSWHGDIYGRVGSTSLGSGARILRGNTHIRQVFTQVGEDTTVDGLWILLKRNSGTENVIAKLTTNIGPSLPQKALSQIAISNSEISTAGDLGSWIYKALPSPITLRSETQYAISLSTGKNTDVLISSSFPLDYGEDYFATDSTSAWGDKAQSYSTAHAEISTDAGVNWSDWGGIYIGRDIPVLLTISGSIRNVSF